MARRSPRECFLAVAIIAASHALAGRIPEARRALAQLRRLDSRLCLGAVADWLPLQRAEHLAMLVDGLRKAGMPE